MIAKNIVEKALSRGLDLIAVTDHNTARMAPVVAKVARERGLAFLYGIELQTREDVHLLAYFNDERTCMAFSDEVYALLPDTRQDPYGLGEQIETDVDGRTVRREERFLVHGLRLGFREAVEWIRAMGGLPVPAHVDRNVFSVSSQLGRCPEGMSFSVIELVGSEVPTHFSSAAILRTSDAHDVTEVGRRRTQLTIKDPTVGELQLAAKALDGRSMYGTE